MIVVFMGTPEFAVPALVKLIEEKYTIALVVTQPDKAKDRGKQVQFSPVKIEAMARGLRVLQPEKIRNNQEFLDAIRQVEPDCIIVAAYGKILPKELLDIPRLGCINIHGSLLPKYRGAAPIQRSIINGDEFTGISIMSMAEDMDTGDVLASAKIPIQGKTSAMLYKELAVLGADLLVKTLSEIERGTVHRIRQNEAEATYAPMISKLDGLVNFTRSPKEIERLIRGLDPWPGAFTYYNEIPVKLRDAEDLEKINEKPPGTITRVSADGIEISSGGGTLLIKKIQFPGKKLMAVKDYILGNSILEGVVLRNREED